MYELVTLDEVKDFLKVSSTNTEYDDVLNRLIPDVTKQIETICSKLFVTRQFTEYHDGKGKPNILLKNYPVYSVTSINDDTTHVFGSGDAIATDDYRIYYDSGEIKLTDDETTFSNGEQNVKVVYHGGYSRFLLVDEANNYIDIIETTSTEYAIEITPATVPDDTIWPGRTPEDLATAVQTALNSSDDLTHVYTVSYNHESQKFTISSGTDFDLRWNTGASSAKNMASLLGYSTSTDTNDGTSHESDNAVTGVPGDIRLAACKLISQSFEDSAEGKGILIVNKVALAQGQGTTEYLKDMPKDVEQILQRYTRSYI